MADPASSLQGILDELHEALEASPEVGEAGRSALHRAAEEIRAALDENGSPAAEDASEGSLVDQLNAALERFEGSHPRLTGIVGRIADSLSDLGI